MYSTYHFVLALDSKYFASFIFFLPLPFSSISYSEGEENIQGEEEEENATPSSASEAAMAVCREPIVIRMRSARASGIAPGEDGGDGDDQSPAPIRKLLCLYCACAMSIAADLQDPR